MKGRLWLPGKMRNLYQRKSSKDLWQKFKKSRFGFFVPVSRTADEEKFPRPSSLVPKSSLCTEENVVSHCAAMISVCLIIFTCL